MTADDVTQRAARVINETNWKADFKGGARADEIAQALADAGLLAPATLTRDESLHFEGRATIPEHTTERLPGDDFVMLITVEGCDGEVMTGPEYEQWLIRHGAKPMTRWVSEWKDRR